ADALLRRLNTQRTEGFSSLSFRCVQAKVLVSSCAQSGQQHDPAELKLTEAICPLLRQRRSQLAGLRVCLGPDQGCKRQYSTRSIHLNSMRKQRRCSARPTSIRVA